MRRPLEHNIFLSSKKEEISISKHFIVLIGNYGSGKTELSLNFALKAAGEGKRCVLADLDIVNPYFRSSEQNALLESHSIRLISPPYARTNVDVPVLSAEVNRVFVEDYDLVIFDVGGDSVGATALGQYYHQFETVRSEVEALYVVNTRRPLAGTAEDIVLMFDQIQLCSRMPITGFINNSNLAGETTAEQLIEGEEVLREVTARTGVPVRYISGKQHILLDLEVKTHNMHLSEKFFPIDIYTRPQWLDL